MKYFGGIYCITKIHGIKNINKNNNNQFNENDIENIQHGVGDLITIIEFLITSGITTSKLLAIYSDGYMGIIISICVNQRPDLFSTIVIQNGLFDLYRYHHLKLNDDNNSILLSTSSIGCCKKIIELSPLYNMGKNECPYPSVLLTTG
jgi:prolyl oligopeptidase